MATDPTMPGTLTEDTGGVITDSIPLTALCRCGSRDSYVVLTLTAVLFGMLTKWRCRACGDTWMTRP